jgi:multiple sugar transport system permease protein/putative aldouronate transport system permease protein
MPTSTFGKKRHNNIVKGNRGFDTFIVIFLVIFTLMVFFPFWLVIINSFATEASISKNGFMVIPSEFTLDGYKYLLSGGQIYRSYANTLFVTIVGTFLATMVSAPYAYVLAHRKVKYRKALSFMTYFAMLMGTGLVGFYILIANWLGLKDSLWALILPRALNPFFVFILVASYREIPYEIYEAAVIDGADDISTFFRVIWPISKPAVATVSMFYALNYWNDWWLALLFIDNYRLHPLQMMIREMVSNINAGAYIGGSSAGITVPTNSIKMVVVCAAVGPIILVYPFIQKYFIKGITLGAVKG